jgi:hypothetical protein
MISSSLPNLARISSCEAARSASRMRKFDVRRDKAALFQRVQGPPGNRSSRKQPGQAWRRQNV